MSKKDKKYHYLASVSGSGLKGSWGSSHQKFLATMGDVEKSNATEIWEIVPPYTEAKRLEEINYGCPMNDHDLIELRFIDNQWIKVDK